MQTINNLLSNSDFSKETSNFTSLLVNCNWILVNDINERKTIYYFNLDNTFTVKKNGLFSKAKWYYVDPNYIKIVSNNDINIIKINFRADDILTLDIEDNINDLAVFVNEDKSKTPLNSYNDITNYLHSKYLNKAKDIVYNHNYYYIKDAEEFGPLTAKELIDKAKNETLSSQCFIRETSDNNYNKRLRIIDLINAFKIIY